MLTKNSPLALLQVEKFIPPKYVADVISYYEGVLLGFDEDSRFSHLFWANGASHFDYKIFGDSLAFDSTYKTNKCQMSLVVMVGSNNHGLACVFGFTLIQNETAETYTWVLQKFLDYKKGKLTEIVLTYGCI